MDGATTQHAGCTKLFPAKFTLTIEEVSNLGWYVTSDVHKGFLHYIAPEEGLPEGLRQVPAIIRLLLVAQMDANIARAKKEGPRIMEGLERD